MKLKIAFILACIVGFQAFSQDEDWYSYEFDSILSVNLPGEVYERDTIHDGRKAFELFTANDSIQFSVKRVYIGKVYENDPNNFLPKDRKGLKELYQTLAYMSSEIRGQDPITSRTFTKDNLLGYKVAFEGNDEYPYSETHSFLINKNMYLFEYSNAVGFDSINQNFFFDSLYFDDGYELIQYKHKRTFYLPITLSILVISFVGSALLRRNNRKGRKFRRTKFH